MKATGSSSALASSHVINDSIPNVSEDMECERLQPLDFIRSFECSNTSNKSMINSQNAITAPKKRKLIELVQTNVPNLVSPEKKKKSVKKPRTITELATSAYVVQEEEENEAVPPGEPELLLQYCSSKSFPTEQSGRVGAGSKEIGRAHV